MRAQLVLILLLALAIPGCRRTQPRVEVEDPPSLALAVDPEGVRLEPGLTARVKVALTRKNVGDPIKLELRNLPAGLTARPVTVAPHEDAREIELTAAPTLAPGEKAGVEAFASTGTVEARSAPFKLHVAKPSITCVYEPALLRIPKGESRTLKVTIQRGREAYQGPLAISLANLPRYVTATLKENAPAGADWAVFTVQAAAEAVETEAQPWVRLEGDKTLRGVSFFPLVVQGAPFLLKAEPERVRGSFGQITRVKITAMRRDYQGPITLALDNLPPSVKTKSITLPAKQTTAEIDLIVAGDAASAERAVQIRGTADDARKSTGAFQLQILGRPFVLQVQPARLEIVQGATAKFKVNVVRAKDFTGPIPLDVRNLPPTLKAASAVIDPQSKYAEIEISADEAAAPGPAGAVQIVGQAQVGTEMREIKYEKATLFVQRPFSLLVQPAKIELVEGQKATVKIVAERRTYKGVIDVQLKNLPPGVTASAGEIARDQTTTTLELTAGPDTSGKVKSDVLALGTPLSKKQVPSGPFTVAVLSRLFELKVDKAAKISFGGKTSIKVTALRKDYDGPIALELKNLPGDCKADKVVLPPGKNEIELELSARDDAKPATHETHVLGTATGAGNQQRTSGNLALQVVPGFFDLKLDAPLIALHHGSTVKLGVTAQRKGHDGPIVVELKNLPPRVTAEKITIPAGETRAEIEVKADLAVQEGAKVDAFARGSAQSKTVDSPRFTVAIGSVGQAPRLQLKVTPATLELAPGAAVKVKVALTRKDYAGPVAVDLRNLPPEIEATKGTIPAGSNEIELTLTARSKMEPSVRLDICAVGVAVMADNQAFASPQVVLKISRK